MSVPYIDKENYVDYYTHFQFEPVLKCVEEYPGEIDSNFINWIKSQMFLNVPSWKEFDFGELNDSTDNRYPRSYWLVAVRNGYFDISNNDDFNLLMNQIDDAWFRIIGDECYFDEEKNVWILRTDGWSGNENILHALERSVYGLLGCIQCDESIGNQIYVHSDFDWRYKCRK